MSLDTPAPGAVLQYERRGPFWFARFNRADKRNALSEDLVEALGLLCDAVGADLEARATELARTARRILAGIPSATAKAG